ncbi:MAG: ChaN family lipoprotein [Rhodocyclaceae bacterium]|nr:ChaN family lipoprotein [Rhodocyclaceae bacterium]
MMAFAVAGACVAAESATALNPPVIAVGQTPRLQQVLADLPDDRIVFVGESHHRFEHHLVQLDTLKFLHQRYGDVAVGVEWFQSPAQGALDDYLAGTISEAQMLERSAYFDRWRFDYRLYRPIIQYARENGLPIVALNAPEALTRKIGRGGLVSLSEEERSQLPADYAAPGAAYVARVREAFDAHPPQERNFDFFLEVMQTWDETMAARAAAHLAAHPGRRMVIFAGNGHVMFGDGIPDRLARRSGVRGTRIVLGAELAGVDGVADFVVLPTERTLPPAGLLGAFLDAGEGGARVMGFAPDSALEAAGLRKDDVVVAIDDVATPDFAALKLALLDRAPGETLRLRYRREGWLGADATREVSVTLRGEPAPAHP